MKLNESKLSQQQRSQLIREFIKYCIKELGLKNPINSKVILTNNKTKTETYAHFNPMNNEVVVYMGERSLGDSMRSLCHELCHLSQKQKGQLQNNSGNTGSQQENEANSKAGILLRNFGKKNPQIFE